MTTLEYNTGKTPRKRSALHLWADWVELVCLEHLDHEISCEDVISEHLGEKGLAGDLLPQEDSDNELKTVPLAGDLTTAERGDVVAAYLNDLSKYLEIRAALLKNDYPFEIESGGYIELKDELRSNHILYIYFLFSANLRLVSDSGSVELSRDFERISAYALRAMLPNNSSIKSFGTVQHPEFERFGGNKKKKLEDLAREIHALAFTDGLSPHDTGDAGIDTVAWFPFEDQAPFMPTYFAQSGCTADEEEMIAKQREVLPLELSGWFKYIWSINIMFTPSCWRNSSGGWITPQRITSIFIDRIRLMKLLSKTFLKKERAKIRSLSLIKKTLKSLNI